MKNVTLSVLLWLFVFTGYGANQKEDWVYQMEFIASLRRQIVSLRAQNAYLVRKVRSVIKDFSIKEGEDKGRAALGLIVIGVDLVDIDRPLSALLEEEVLESSFIVGLPRPDLVLELITWVQEMHIETRIFLLKLL